MEDQQLGQLMAQTISTSKYKWRTVRSIARQVGADRKQAERVLQNSTNFVRAKTPNARGEALYTTSERYRKETPLLERIFGAGANTVGQ
jgi:hypothetical protein